MNAINFLIPAMIIAADQMIKRLVTQNAAENVLWKIEGFAEIVCSKNTGAAFSLLSGQTVLIACLSVVLLIGIVCFAFRSLRLNRAGKLAFLCLIGGGVGNLLDRLLFGYVIDYIRLTFIDFPVFNFADIVITVSVGFLMILLMSDRLEWTQEKNNGRNT